MIDTRRLHLTTEIRTELRNLARRFDDAELEGICDRAADRETLLSELEGRPGWRDLSSIMASYSDSLEDEQILELLQALSPDRPLFGKVFADDEQKGLA